MNYKEHIENALIYIETNLKTDFHLDDLAGIAGYSKYHFIRVFKEVIRLTPADYIRKRRLTEIAREITQSNRPISDIAFEYGFNSKENFTRAFLGEHHVLPTEYKVAGNSLKLFEHFSSQVQPIKVIPKIIKLSDFSLTAIKSDEDYAPNFWNKYNCKKLSAKLSGGKIVADYGTCLWNNNTKHLDYWCGIRTEEALGDISGTCQLNIQGGLYAVFATPPTTHIDFVNTIHRTWRYIFSIWIPESRYKFIGGHQFESYVEASRTFSEDIYIPIVEK